MNLTENIIKQIKGFNPNGEEIEIIFKESFTNLDGYKMKRGYYFYFKDIPEEGIIGPFIDEKKCALNAIMSGYSMILAFLCLIVHDYRRFIYN